MADLQTQQREPRTETIAERFARETANHEMTVLHNDGLYRHLHFRSRWWQPPLLKQQTSSTYWFDLITVPGTLIFQGDGESYVFARVEDMFEFFRGPVGQINPGYWSEKLTSDRGSVMRYDEEIFERTVAEALKEAEKDWPGVTAAWTAKFEWPLADYFSHDEHAARAALDDFEFGIVYKATCSCGDSKDFPEEYDATLWRSRHITTENAKLSHRSSVERVDGFRFYDTWEWPLEDYHWWFLWACHAIVWGIAQFDHMTSRGDR